MIISEVKIRFSLLVVELFEEICWKRVIEGGSREYVSDAARKERSRRERWSVRISRLPDLTLLQLRRTRAPRTANPITVRPAVTPIALAKHFLTYTDVVQTDCGGPPARPSAATCRQTHHTEPDPMPFPGRHRGPEHGQMHQ